jgi:hypothetical protein
MTPSSDTRPIRNGRHSQHVGHISNPAQSGDSSSSHSRSQIVQRSGRMTPEDAQRAQAYADTISDKDVSAELRRVWDHFGAGTVWTNYKRLVAQAQAQSDQKTALEHALHASSWREALATLQCAGMTRSKARAALVKAGRKPGS